MSKAETKPAGFEFYDQSAEDGPVWRIDPTGRLRLTEVGERQVASQLAADGGHRAFLPGDSLECKVRWKEEGLVEYSEFYVTLGYETIKRHLDEMGIS